MEKYREFVQKGIDWAFAHPFQSGFCSGITAFVLIVLVFLIAGWLLRPRRVSVLSFTAKNGLVMIGAAAISDLVLSLQHEFKDLTLVRIGIFRKHRQIYLEVVIDFIRGGESFPVLATRFQDRAIASIKESFGIDSVQQVRLRVRNTTAVPVAKEKA